MITRRKAVQLLCSAPAILAGSRLLDTRLLASAKADDTPPLAPGAPDALQRTALIDAFKKQSEGLEKQFEARSLKAEWTMPYRLFKPQAKGTLPLVVYLHGSGGLGDDNQKQLELGNVFGTRVWLLPENQKQLPCYVLAPQTDRGWNNYDESKQSATPLPGLGEGSRLALQVIDALRREFAIDEHRIYVTGQSMGGAGTWNMLTHRPNFFAAAVICCAAPSAEDGTASIKTPVWNFHGSADEAVPVATSRDRMAARRKAGGHPLYTEYAGVDHTVWRWAYTEPELPKWMFSQRRG